MGSRQAMPPHRISRFRPVQRPWTGGAALIAVALLASCSSGTLGMGQTASPSPAPNLGSGLSSPAISTGPALGSSESGGPGPHVVVAPRGTVRQDELDVVNGAATVSISVAALGANLLRVSTPANSSVRPDLVTGHAAQVYLDSTGDSGPAAVSIVLNSAVTWRLLLAGGASQTSADLRGGRLSGADFSAGTSLLSMTLPQPSGTVTVEVAGGASQLTLSLPTGVPAQLRLDGGASTVSLFGQRHTGISGGTVLTSPGWAQAHNRYVLYAPAGVSTVDVTG